MASITFGPPGWQTHQADVVAGQAVVGEEAVDVRRGGSGLTMRGNLGVQHDPQAARW